MKAVNLGNPYPMRLEDDAEAMIAELIAETGIDKAKLLRMAIRAGLSVVDWEKYKKPVLSISSGHLRKVLKRGVEIASAAKSEPEPPLPAPTRQLKPSPARKSKAQKASSPTRP